MPIAIAIQKIPHLARRFLARDAAALLVSCGDLTAASGFHAPRIAGQFTQSFVKPCRELPADSHPLLTAHRISQLIQYAAKMALVHLLHMLVFARHTVCASTHTRMRHQAWPIEKISWPVCASAQSGFERCGIMNSDVRFPPPQLTSATLSPKQQHRFRVFFCARQGFN